MTTPRFSPATLDALALTAAPTPRLRLSQSPTYLRLMAEAKAEFARQISESRWKPGRRAS